MSLAGSKLPSPQSMVALKFSWVGVCDLSNPGSENMTGSRVMNVPSVVIWLPREIAALTVGSTLSTVTSNVSHTSSSSSSATQTVTVYVPLSA